jgi:CHAD domain-containing protein
VHTSERASELAERMRRWSGDLSDLLAQVRADGADVELFHGLRVLIRRLRSAMRFLTEAGAPHVRGARALDRALRRIATAAGPVRDADVLEEHVRELRELPDPGEAGWAQALDVLAEELAERREANRRALVVKATETASLARLARTGEIAGQLALAAPDDAALARQLLARVDDLAQLVQHAQAHASDPEEWHRARIGIKRVRYCLELLAGRESPLLEGLVRMQGTLGKAHDHRVWQAHARDLRKRLPKRGSDVLARAGLAGVAAREASAAEGFEQRFSAEWEQFSPDFRAQLLPALGIEPVAGEPPPPPAGAPGSPAREGDRA